MRASSRFLPLCLLLLSFLNVTASAAAVEPHGGMMR